MEISRLGDLRPRTVWDVADDAFDLYRENFALFAGIAAVVLVPGYLAFTAWLATLPASPGGGDPAAAALLGAAVILPFFGIAYVLYSGATAAAVEDRLSGRPTGIFPACRRALRRFWPLLGASLVVGLLALSGACTLYIGTIVVFVYYAFVSQAVVLEGRGVLEAGRRSRALVSGNGDKVFGLLVLLFVLSLLLSAGIAALLGAALALVPAAGAGDAAARELRDMVLGQVAQALSSVLLAPLNPIATTLLYYDLRVRREGLDIEAQAAAIDYPLAPDPFGGVANPKVPPAAPAGAGKVPQ